MSNGLLQSTLREMHTLLIRPRLWLVFAVVVSLFVLTGPFGTYERLAFPTRLGYWLVLHAVTWTCALASISLFDVALAGRFEQRMIRMLVGAIVSCVPIGLAISVINFALLMRPLNGERIVDNIMIALPIALGFSVLSWMSLSGATGPLAQQEAEQPGSAQATTEDGAAPGSGKPVPPEAVARPALIDRLPVDKRGTLVRLEVQDHYVLVVTSRGSELLLMRLGDAIAETGGAGQQIHRSHWVADDGVRALARQGGRTPRLVVETVDGQSLPVSRTYAADVRARWSDRQGK